MNDASEFWQDIRDYNKEREEYVMTDTKALFKGRARKARQIKQASEINALKREVKDMKEMLLKINEKLKWQEQ